MYKSAIFQIMVVFVAPVFTVGNAGAESIEADSVLIRLIEEVDIPAQALGSLSAVYVIEGDTVKRGKLLAQIDDTEARLRHERAQIELEMARHQASNDAKVRSAAKAREFARAEFGRLSQAEAIQPRSVSESELEKSRLDSEQAELELERVRHELDMAKIQERLASKDFELGKRDVDIRQIVAPMDGVVVSVFHQSGEWVTPGDKVFRLVRTDRLRAEGFVRAKDVESNLRGAPITLVPEVAWKSGKSVSGKVVFVSPEIDPVNEQIRVWAEIENPQGSLRPGLRARMIIRTDDTPDRSKQ